jgi:hypothetical protein
MARPRVVRVLLPLQSVSRVAEDTVAADKEPDVKLKPTTRLDAAERISRVVSIAAIPVVLAVGGWIIQRQFQNQTVSRDYVQLAVTILQNPDRSKVPPELREWAVDLLNDNSPTKLNAKALASLKSGTVTLPSLNFIPSSALTPDLESQLERTLIAFQSYLEKLGYPPATRAVSVEITSGTSSNGWVARFEANTSRIVVASAFAGDNVSVLRQLAHPYLYTADTSAPEYAAMESGLATYFPSSFLDHPVMGDRATAEGKKLFPPQDLRNRRHFDEIHLGDNGSEQTEGSEIWGGAFWEVRELLGKDVADRLLADAWRAFRPAKDQRTGVYTTFVLSLIERLKAAGTSAQPGELRALFTKRGLTLPAQGRDGA